MIDMTSPRIVLSLQAGAVATIARNGRRAHADCAPLRRRPLLAVRLHDRAVAPRRREPLFVEREAEAGGVIENEVAAAVDIDRPGQHEVAPRDAPLGRVPGEFEEGG